MKRDERKVVLRCAVYTRVRQASSRTITSIAASSAAMSRACSANKLVAHQQTRRLRTMSETLSSASRSVRRGSKLFSASPSSAKGRIDY